MINNIVFTVSPNLLDSISDNTRMTAENTQFSTIDWISFGVAVLAFFVSLLSVVYAHFTYFSQRQTEEHTKSTQSNTTRITLLSQQGLLEDMVRHLYRNLVVTYAIKVKLDYFGWEKCYPSEEHFIKLKVPLENIHLEAFYGDERTYPSINNLYFLLRNYNTEIDIALMHFPQKDIDVNVKKRDLDTLLFKPGYIVERIMNILRELNLHDIPTSTVVSNKIIESHEENLKKKRGSAWPYDIVKYDMEDTEFVKCVFKGHSETSYSAPSFTTMFNQDVFIECGRNGRESEKIYMIMFENGVGKNVNNKSKAKSKKK